MTTMLPTVAVFVIMMNSFTQGGVLSNQLHQLCDGKIQHPENCYKYISCGKDEHGNPDNLEMDCAFFTTFDDRYDLCVHNDQITCQRDPCLNMVNNQKTEATGNCRGYYECSNGKTNLMCCQQSYMFDSVTQRCIFNDSCTAICRDQPAQESIVVCDKTANTGDEGFLQYDNGVQTYIPCSKGSVYNAEACGCNGTSKMPAKADQCQAEVYLTFEDGSISDKSGKNTHVLGTNVNVESGKAIFNGNGKILINRFNNMGAKYLYIAINYTSTGTGNVERVIVSDQCAEGNTDYSIMLTENTAAKQVYFEANSANNINERLMVSDGTTGQLKTVAYRLDNGRLIGMVYQENPPFSQSSISDKSKALGSLKQIPCGLQIGYASGKSGFVGTIDAVTIYSCDPSAK